GATFRLTEQRGKFLETCFAAKTLATYHPSAILRGDTPQARENLYSMLLHDLAVVADESGKSISLRASTPALAARTGAGENTLLR
ncbi:MAG: uracil-DNA glycosylase, partial [Candidatus Acidiferrum sp.]